METVQANAYFSRESCWVEGEGVREEVRTSLDGNCQREWSGYGMSVQC